MIMVYLVVFVLSSLNQEIFLHMRFQLVLVLLVY